MQTLAKRLSSILTAPSLQAAAEVAVAHLHVSGAAGAVWLEDDAGVRSLLAGSSTDGGLRVRGEAASGAVIEVTAAQDDAGELETVALALAATADRAAAEQRAAQAEDRLVDSQRVGRMGSFDWDIARDINRWSDELFRLYGLEPGEVAPSYEQFVALLHPDDREHVRAAHARSLATGEPFAMEERIILPDGGERILLSCGEVVTDDDGQPQRLVGVCRDITEQRAAESEATRAQRRIVAAELQRRQALELNDTVVQGLVAILWRLREDDTAACRDIAETTLAAAKGIMEDLLFSAHAQREPNFLVRSTHTSLARGDAPVVHPASGEQPPTAASGCRVVLADDAPEIRAVLRVMLGRAATIDLVGEASDGRQAVELVAEHRPDVVVLDLSMPRLDGLAAAGEIRELAPETHVIVFSGYPAETMRDEAMAAGADVYVEKTSTLDALVRAITDAPARGRRTGVPAV